jgi:cytidylate kinase
VTIVAISRELGSAGTTIGAAVAKELGFRYVDREVILKAAEAHHVPAEALEAVDERRLTFWERFDEEKRRFLVFIESAFYAHAEEGNVVMVGRGGPILLQGVSHAVRARIMAPFEVRVRRVMEEYKLDQRAATARVRSYDREQSARQEFLFGVDWAAPEHYDLVINTAHAAWNHYVDLLVWLARSPRYQPTPESLQRVKDLSLASRVRSALAADPTTKNIDMGVTAREGVVSLRGVVFSPAMMETVVEVARRVPGVRNVTTEAVEVPQMYPGPIM